MELEFSHIKDISKNLVWLSEIHGDDWDYGNGFIAIYEEIIAKPSWLLSGAKQWNVFCDEVALQAGRPVNYGIGVFDSAVEFKNARDRWQSLGYEFQFIKPVKGIMHLLNPNAYRLSDSTD